MSAHGYDKKRFPLTAAQGRVLYHLERLFRSTGHGAAQYAEFLADVRAYGLDVRRVADWSTFDCVQALAIMEYDARPMAGYRPIDTGRGDFMPGGRFAP